MPDDGVSPARARPARSALVALTGAALLLPPGPARAQTFSGSAEVQYQNLDRAALAHDRDTWDKILQMDYGNTLPGQFAMTSSFRFVEQTVARQSDRVRVPEARVSLAHRYFGFSTAVRPSETRDSRGLITHQQDLTLSAYAQRAKLPSLSASWVRSRFDASALLPGNVSTATVTRSLASSYTLPHVTIRAGYGDRYLDDGSTWRPRQTENHVGLGGSSQFQFGRAPVSLQYDFGQARARANPQRSLLSQSHLVNGQTSLQLGRKTSASLAYNYRRTLLPGVPGSTSQEHNGGANLSYVLNPVVSFSTGGGVRSAQFGSRTQTERYVAASAVAQGRVREGWQMTGSASHSVSWLPDGLARPSDQAQTTATMKLVKGLDLRGDLSVATAKPVLLRPDTMAFPRQFAVQSGFGLSAYPLRSLYLDAGISRSHAGRSIGGAGVTSTTYSTGLRLTPYSAMLLAGRWGLVDGPGSRSTNQSASAQWSVASALQLSASYSRGRQEISFPSPGFVSSQESLAGALTIRLAEDLNASAQYNEANRGRPNRTRQITLNLVRRFGG